MTANNIGVGVHYLSVPEHPVYQERFGWQPEDYPIAMRIGRQTISLPLAANLTDADVRRVIQAVQATLTASIKLQSNKTVILTGKADKQVLSPALPLST
jgi:dTDP-4-amino-4,6-dideoxygalactose transaminase